MAKRFYLSPYVQAPGPLGQLTWLPKVTTDAQVAGWTSIAPSDGGNAVTWALVLVNAADHTALLADATARALPDLTLDTAITAAQATAINSALVKFGMSNSITANAGDTLRQLLRAIGSLRLKNFDEALFSAAVD